MTGSHSRLGISDRESRTTGVIRAYDTGSLTHTRHAAIIIITKQCKLCGAQLLVAHSRCWNKSYIYGQLTRFSALRESGYARLGTPIFLFLWGTHNLNQRSRVIRLSMQEWRESAIFAMLKYCLAVLTLLRKRLLQRQKRRHSPLSLGGYIHNFLFIRGFLFGKMCWAVTFVVEDV